MKQGVKFDDLSLTWMAAALNQNAFQVASARQAGTAMQASNPGCNAVPGRVLETWVVQPKKAVISVAVHQPTAVNQTINKQSRQPLLAKVKPGAAVACSMLVTRVWLAQRQSLSTEKFSVLRVFQPPPEVHVLSPPLLADIPSATSSETAFGGRPRCQTATSNTLRTSVVASSHSCTGEGSV